MDNKRVLIVDDEVAFLVSIKKLLQSFEFEIHTAETLREAMDLLSKYNFYAVVTDLRLSTVMGKEGFEILKYIRQHIPATIVIILTGYGGGEAMETAYALGANVYLEKPVPADVLRGILEDSAASEPQANQ